MSNIHYMITRSKIKNENSSNNTGNTDDDSDDEDYEPYKHVSKKQKTLVEYLADIANDNVEDNIKITIEEQDVDNIIELLDNSPSSSSSESSLDEYDEELCCLITSTHRIPVGEYIFWDWED